MRIAAEQRDILHDKGTNRLLADIANAPTPDIVAQIRAVAAEVKEFAPDFSVAPAVGAHVFASQTVADAGAVAVEWSCWLLGPTSRTETVKANNPADLVEAAKAAIRKLRRMAEFEARYARERAEIEAAEKATRDDGDATTGTLPLVRLGHGDYTREVKP